MKVFVKRWLSMNPHCPVGRYLTGVVIQDNDGLTALTFPGQLKRKQVLAKAWDALSREGRHSPKFLKELRDLIAGKR